MRRTGVPVVDSVIGGVGPGLPLVLAGPPGCGRTVLSLQIAAAALAADDIVAFLSAEPAPLLLQQAASLGLSLTQAVVDEQLILCELDPAAPASLAASGGRALVDAIRAEHPSVSLAVIDPFTMLTGEFLDEAPLRSVAREMIAATPRTTLVLCVETGRPGPDAPVERVLAEVCGTYLKLDRAPDGLRTLRVTKTRAGAGRAEAVEFRIGRNGAELCREIGAGREPEPPRVEISPPPPAECPQHVGGEPQVAPPPVLESPPVARAEAPAEAPARQPAPPSPSETDPRRERPQILVVDDDESTRERFGHWLGERYEVTTASDGFAAMTRILERRPDLIVLDLEMPRVSGYELLGALYGISQSIPILALGAGSSHRAGDRMGPLVLGAADVVAKPVDRFDLLHKTDMLLRLEGPPPRLMDPEEARALFDWTARTRVLEDDRFRARLDRACEFGVRFGIPSSLLAVAAPSADVLDRMVTAAEATLRFEDAVLVVSKRRMLILLVAAEQAHCAAVLDRIASNAGGDEPAPRVQWQASAALPSAEHRDWRVLFRDLEEHAVEEAT